MLRKCLSGRSLPRWTAAAHLTQRAGRGRQVEGRYTWWAAPLHVFRASGRRGHNPARKGLSGGNIPQGLTNEGSLIVFSRGFGIQVYIYFFSIVTGRFWFPSVVCFFSFFIIMFNCKVWIHILLSFFILFYLSSSSPFTPHSFVLSVFYFLLFYYYFFFHSPSPFPYIFVIPPFSFLFRTFLFSSSFPCPFLHNFTLINSASCPPSSALLPYFLLAISCPLLIHFYLSFVFCISFSHFTFSLYFGRLKLIASYPIFFNGSPSFPPSKDITSHSSVYLEQLLPAFPTLLFILTVSFSPSISSLVTLSHILPRFLSSTAMLTFSPLI